MLNHQEKEKKKKKKQKSKFSYFTILLTTSPQDYIFMYMNLGEQIWCVLSEENHRRCLKILLPYGLMITKKKKKKKKKNRQKNKILNLIYFKKFCI